MSLEEQIQEIIECAKANRRKIFLYTKQLRETIGLINGEIEEFINHGIRSGKNA